MHVALGSFRGFAVPLYIYIHTNFLLVFSSSLLMLRSPDSEAPSPLPYDQTDQLDLVLSGAGTSIRMSCLEVIWKAPSPPQIACVVFKI